MLFKNELSKNFKKNIDFILEGTQKSSIFALTKTKEKKFLKIMRMWCNW